MNYLATTIATGIGATAFMDLWGIARKFLFGMAPPDYGMVGRWIAHMPRGRFVHNAIAAAPAMPAERLIGWTAHYLIGITFAAILVGVCGTAWLERPTIGPALMIGVVTVAAPFLIMQPGMGAGIAASRTKNPAAARRQSLVTHTMFGLGLYVAGLASRLLLAATTV